MFVLQGLSSLTRLSALTDLTVRNVSMSDGLVRSIGACSQLKELRLNIQPCSTTSKALSVDGIMSLTELTALTYLSLYVNLGANFINEILVSCAQRLATIAVTLVNHTNTTPCSMNLQTM